MEDLSEKNQIEREEITESIDKFPRKRSSRRSFLKNVVKLAKTTLIGSALGTGLGYTATEIIYPKKKNSIPSSENIAKDLLPENTEKELTDQELLNKILETPLGLPEREDLENNYLSKVKTLDQINQGFLCLAILDFRAQLLDLKWEERIKNNTKLKPLSPELIAQAIKQGIHPEVFAVCFDARGRAIEMAQKIFGQTRSEIEKIMPNIGEMATRICSETGLKYPKGKFKDLIYGFINIGNKSAISQTNTNLGAFPNTKTELEEIISIVKVLTNLNFQDEIYPGSTPRGQGDLSGGAIGPLQFMPPTVLEMYDLINHKTGQKLNFLDPEEATIMALIFIIKYKPKMWNNDQRQMEEIRAGGQLFQSNLQKE